MRRGHLHGRLHDQLNSCLLSCLALHKGPQEQSPRLFARPAKVVPTRKNGTHFENWCPLKNVVHTAFVTSPRLLPQSFPATFNAPGIRTTTTTTNSPNLHLAHHSAVKISQVVFALLMRIKQARSKRHAVTVCIRAVKTHVASNTKIERPWCLAVRFREENENQASVPFDRKSRRQRRFERFHTHTTRTSNTHTPPHLKPLCQGEYSDAQNIHLRHHNMGYCRM